MFNRYLLTLTCLVLLSPGLISQSLLSDSMVCNYQNEPLLKLIQQLENEAGFSFYFKEDWIEGKTISTQGSYEIKRLLSESLSQNNLDYVFKPPNKIIILEDPSFMKEFPVISSDESWERIVTKTPTLNSESPDNDNFIRGRHTDELFVLSIGNQNKQIENRKSSVTGFLADAEDNSPLVGATIYIPELSLGAATDTKGQLSLRIYPGEYSVVFRCIGMRETKCVLQVFSDGEFSCYLKKDRQQIEAVTVVAKYDFKMGGEELGLEKINMKQIKELPTFMGEKDVVKIAQLLPGIVSVNEASSGINVRGGNADQNMFYLDNIALYNTSHAFGFFSAINPGLIRDFSIHKGYVPARYGGRLSSIFLIETTRGSREKFFAQGGISPISGNLVLESPLIKKKISVVLSARSSFSNWIMNRMPNDNLKNSEVKFNDLALSASYNINEKNSTNFMVYNSNDYYSLNNLNEVDYSNFGSGLEWEHRFNTKIKSNYALTYSKYTSGTSDLNDPSSAYTHSYKLNHTAFNTAFIWRAHRKHKLNFGGTLISYNLNRGKVEPLGNESERTPTDLGLDNGLEGALFIEDEYSITNRLTINAGIRYSFFFKFGPEEVYTYGEDQPPSEESITGSRSYEKGEKVTQYGRPNLRFSLDYKANNSNSFLLSYSELSQYIFSLSSTYSVAPSDQWKLCDSYIRPGFSRQLSLGYNYTSSNKGYTLTAETYLKKMDNILEFKDGADFIETKNIETQVLQGQQEAYGFEFMLSKNLGNIKGWVTYAFSRSFIRVDGENSWDKINKGESYPSNYDKPHVLNFIGSYRFNKRFVLSTNVVYSTGRPITLPQTSYYINSMQYVDYSSRNEFRLADYFRLDMSLSMEGNLKKKKAFHSFWMLNIYNVTGRENPYSIYFSSDEGQIKGYKYSVIGVPIVTISWNFKLGNYNNE